MPELMQKATQAATMTVGEVTSVRHAQTLAEGSQVFHVVCRERARGHVTVTINPNGHKAAVEWKSGARGTNYRICDLRHMNSTKRKSITKEEKAIA